MSQTTRGGCLNGAEATERLAAGWADEVLEWAASELRDLPWRRTRDPWAILVSEVMLQQTPIARVIPKWEAFLARYPDPESCAAAPFGEILRLWQGLGYPRRARNLHTAASEIARRGEFPADLETLLRLPGIGDYTARAVRAFAFEIDGGVVDTNIARLYARMVGSRLTRGVVQDLADRHCPPGGSWEWNQALMDLGATVCRSRSPLCSECPVTSRCRWGGATAVADPALGSGGVSGRQARFEGSDRQARGRLLKALGDGPVDESQVPRVMERDPDAATRLVNALIADGLCSRREDMLHLGD